MFQVRRIYLHHVPPRAEGAPDKGDVVTLVMDCHKLTEEIVPVDRISDVKGHLHFLVILRASQAVNAGHGRHHDDVITVQN